MRRTKGRVAKKQSVSTTPAQQAKTPNDTRRPAPATPASSAKKPLLSTVLKKQLESNERREQAQSGLTLMDFRADLK